MRSRAVAIDAAADSGAARLVPDRRRAGGWALLVEGVAQSYVNLRDPRQLEFPYVRTLAAVSRAALARQTGGVPSVLHLGAGALTLPRYVAAVWPGARQVVVERDAALADFVLRALPLPPGVEITLTIADARAAVEATPGGSFDLVIADVYQAAQMPTRVASVEFARQAMRVLRDPGVYATNVVDLPPLTLSRIQAATLSAAFGDVCLVAEPGMLRGRRYGNVVLAACRNQSALPVRTIARLIGREGRLLHGAELDGFVMGTGPMVDA